MQQGIFSALFRLASVAAALVAVPAAAVAAAATIGEVLMPMHRSKSELEKFGRLPDLVKHSQQLL